MIETEALMQVINLIQEKVEQGGHLDVDVEKIIFYLEQNSLALDTTCIMNLHALNQKISCLNELSSAHLQNEICKVFNGATTLFYSPQLLQNLSNTLATKLNAFPFQEEMMELDMDELEFFDSLPPEDQALFFNENGMQLPSSDILIEMLIKCGNFVTQLNLYAILGEENVRDLNCLGLEKVLSCCPILKQLYLMDVYLQERDPLAIIAKHCHELETLVLTGCQSLTAQGLEQLMIGCPPIQYLDLSNCAFIDNSLDDSAAKVCCASIQTLILSGCKFSPDDNFTHQDET